MLEYKGTRVQPFGENKGYQRILYQPRCHSYLKTMEAFSNNMKILCCKDSKIYGKNDLKNHLKIWFSCQSNKSKFKKHNGMQTS